MRYGVQTTSILIYTLVCTQLHLSARKDGVAVFICRHVQQPLHAVGLHALWQCEAQQAITGGSTDSSSDCLCYLPLLFFLPPVFLLSPLVVVLLICR